MLKNKILAIICSIMLILPVLSVETPDTINVNNNENVIETLSDENSNNSLTEAENLPENAVTEKTLTQDLNNQTYKQPTSKRKIAKKFLFAMLGVVVSSLLIFGILSFYNKIRSSFLKEGSILSPNDKNSLDSPEDMEDAIKSFLDKTKWD